MTISRRLLSVIALALIGAPASAVAQGSCSVPHGSPAAPTNGYVLTQAPKAGWIQVAFSHLDSREHFNPLGESEQFISSGRLRTTSAFITGVVGVVEGLDVWAQLAFHRLNFSEQSGSRSATGFGDPRFYVRVGPELFGLRRGALPLAVALRGGVKLPGREFPVDQQLIPITEGQVDWELLVEVGRTFDPLPIYVMGWAGYRWRTENTKITRDPGDETFAYFAAGTNAGPLTLRLGVQKLWGSPPTIFNIELPTARRQMFEFLPTIGGRIGPGELQLGGRLPVTGRNLPGGTAFTLGYLLSWGNKAPETEWDPTELFDPGR